MKLHKIPIENTDFLWLCEHFSKSIHIFANFTIGMIGNETGHLLECVMLYGKCINKSETLAHLEQKYCCYFTENFIKKNLCSVKCYDKSNMNALTLSIWESFRWGLIYFDQFILKGIRNLTFKCIEMHIASNKHICQRF